MNLLKHGNTIFIITSDAPFQLPNKFPFLGVFKNIQDTWKNTTRMYSTHKPGRRNERRISKKLKCHNIFATIPYQSILN